MDTLSQMTVSMREALGPVGPHLLAIVGALALLIIGWFIALALRAGTRKAGSRLRLNERVQTASGQTLDLERWLAMGVYLLALLLVLIGFFSVLNLPLVAGPLQGLADSVFAYLPLLAAAGLLILVALLVATILHRLVLTGFSYTSFDEKVSHAAGTRPISATLADVAYWLTLLLFLPGILGVLRLEGLLLPVQDMVDDLVGVLPNLLAAAAIALVGWFIARVLRDLVTNVLQATGIDGLGPRMGLKDSFPPSRLVALVVYIAVLVPAIIAALDALRIEAVSQPATAVLSTFLSAIPALLAAAALLIVAWFVARIVADLVVSLLEGLGFDRLPAKLGLSGAVDEAGGRLSRFAGRVIVFFVMLFATMEAANQLAFYELADLIESFIRFGGEVLLGVAIIAVGAWIANVAHRTILGLSGERSSFLAGLARYAILGLVLAMGLRAMGVANDIVELAFGLTLGAIAVAFALSFGLGGREAAGRQLEHWFGRLRGGSGGATPPR